MTKASLKYKFIGKSVWIEKEKVLVIADLHIGYEESLNLGLRSQYKEIIRDMEKIFEEINEKLVKEIIILGDLKHELGRVSEQEWKEVYDFLEYLEGKCEKIVLVKGNHDNILGVIAEKKKIEVKEYYVLGEYGFLHGDKRKDFGKEIKVIFLGHLHPAVTLQEEAKRESYKCFLVGKFEGKEIVILPSFFPLIEGSEVRIEDNNLDFGLDLEKCEVFVPSDREILDFGKVHDIGRLD